MIGSSRIALRRLGVCYSQSLLSGRQSTGLSAKEDTLVQAAKEQGVRLASRAAREAPDYLNGLLSWRDQLKKGRLTIYLDTSAVNHQLDQLRGITATLVVGVLVGAAMIASAMAEMAF